MNRRKFLGAVGAAVSAALLPEFPKIEDEFGHGPAVRDNEWGPVTFKGVPIDFDGLTQAWQSGPGPDFIVVGKDIYQVFKKALKE